MQVNQTMKPQIISREIIKPSSPTPNSKTIYRLSLLDQTNLRVHVPILLFYQNGGDISHRASQLKKSLSHTLTGYYPLAGRIKGGGIIECNDEGVEFCEARMSCKLEEFLKHPEFETLEPLLPGELQWSNADLSNTLLIQITFFECGGMAIGLCMSHKAGDASTLSSFVEDWGAATRESGEETSPHFITSLFPPPDSLIMPDFEVERGKYVATRLVFDAQKLGALKALASSFGVENPTRVQVVTALIYRCAVAAFRASSGSRRPSILLQIANLRQRLVPPVPEKSFGNMGWFYHILTTEESETEFRGLVGELKSRHEHFCESFGRSFTREEWSGLICDAVKGMRSFATTEGQMGMYTFSSWCRFPFYQVDFGWGKPIWVTSGNNMFKNITTLMNSPTGDGIEALVSLEKQEMAIFERDEELLQFASLNPSPLGGSFQIIFFGTSPVLIDA